MIGGNTVIERVVFIDYSYFGRCEVEIHKDGDIELKDYDGDKVCFSRSIAISTARAILKHFGEGLE